MKPKQILGYAVIAFIFFFVIKWPNDASGVVTSISNFLSSVARDFSSFLSAL